jgi:beta-lactamase class A
MKEFEFAPRMMVVDVREWDALQAELQELRKITQNTSSPLSPEQEEWFNVHKSFWHTKAQTTDDPQEPYGKTDWKAIVDSGKTIEDEKGNELYINENDYYIFWNPSPITLRDWQSVERKMQQSKGWKIK